MSGIPKKSTKTEVMEVCDSDDSNEFEGAKGATELAEKEPVEPHEEIETKKPDEESPSKIPSGIPMRTSRFSSPIHTKNLVGEGYREFAANLPAKSRKSTGDQAPLDSSVGDDGKEHPEELKLATAAVDAESDGSQSGDSQMQSSVIIHSSCSEDEDHRPGSSSLLYGRASGSQMKSEDDQIHEATTAFDESLDEIEEVDDEVDAEPVTRVRAEYVYRPFEEEMHIQETEEVETIGASVEHPSEEVATTDADTVELTEDHENETADEPASVLRESSLTPRDPTENEEAAAKEAKHSDDGDSGHLDEHDVQDDSQEAAVYGSERDYAAEVRDEKEDELQEADGVQVQDRLEEEVPVSIENDYVPDEEEMVHSPSSPEDVAMVEMVEQEEKAAVEEKEKETDEPETNRITAPASPDTTGNQDNRDSEECHLSTETEARKDEHKAHSPEHVADIHEENDIKDENLVEIIEQETEPDRVGMEEVEVAAEVVKTADEDGDRISDKTPGDKSTADKMQTSTLSSMFDSTETYKSNGEEFEAMVRANMTDSMVGAVTPEVEEPDVSKMKAVVDKDVDISYENDTIIMKVSDIIGDAVGAKKENEELKSASPEVSKEVEQAGTESESSKSDEEEKDSELKHVYLKDEFPQSKEIIDDGNEEQKETLPVQAAFLEDDLMNFEKKSVTNATVKDEVVETRKQIKVKRDDGPKNEPNMAETVESDFSLLSRVRPAPVAPDSYKQRSSGEKTESFSSKLETQENKSDTAWEKKKYGHNIIERKRLLEAQMSQEDKPKETSRAGGVRSHAAETVADRRKQIETRGQTNNEQMTRRPFNPWSRDVYEPKTISNKAADSAEKFQGDTTAEGPAGRVKARDIDNEDPDKTDGVASKTDAYGMNRTRLQELETMYNEFESQVDDFLCFAESNLRSPGDSDGPPEVLRGEYSSFCSNTRAFIRPCCIV